MSKQATVARFEDDGTRGANGEVLGGGWYKPPPDFTLHFEAFRQRATIAHDMLVAAGLAPDAPRTDAGPKIGVIGCGYGFLCWHLWDMGWQAWGMDNVFAQSQARSGKLPNISDHILLGDANVQANVDNFRAQAGIGANQRFAGLITDDLFSCVDSATELSTMLTIMRNRAMPSQSGQRNRVIHFITMYDPSQPWSGGLPIGAENDGFWRTEAEWVTLIGTNAERIVNLAGFRVVR